MGEMYLILQSTSDYYTVTRISEHETGNILDLLYPVSIKFSALLISLENTFMYVNSQLTLSGDHFTSY